jgi:hypothetical protein
MMSHLYFNYLEPFFKIIPKIPKNKIFGWTSHSYDPVRAVLHGGNELTNLNRRSEQMELTQALVNANQCPTDDDNVFRQ